MRKNEFDDLRPWGQDGPRFRIIPDDELPKEGSELSYHGYRILRNIPKERGSAIGIRSLADNLSALGDYAGFSSMIEQLADGGYLKMDKNHFIKLTKKGKSERKDIE